MKLQRSYRLLLIAIAIEIAVAIPYMVYRNQQRSESLAQQKKCFKAQWVVRDAADQYTADKRMPPISLKELEIAGYLKEGAYPAQCSLPAITSPLDVPLPDRKFG